jgi:DNA-binding PadR family transcriptional regulator
MARNAELLSGTLDMRILKAVSLGALHGYGVLLRIGQISKDALSVPQGSLYPALRIRMGRERQLASSTEGRDSELEPHGCSDCSGSRRQSQRGLMC